MNKKDVLGIGLVFAVIVSFVGISALSNIIWGVEESGNDKVSNVETIETENITTSFFDVYRIADFGQGAYGLTSGDFNSDGNIDLAVSWATLPFEYAAISIFYNDGNAEFTQDDVFTLSYDNYIKDLDSGDYDNDGDIDLIFTYNEIERHDGMSYNMNGTINILFNEGENRFGGLKMIAKRGTGIPFDTEARINPQVTSGDYDMDGDIDLLLGDNSGKVEIFENDGTGNFTTGGVIHDFGSLSWGLTSGDFDKDGYIDFIVAAELKERQAHGRCYLKRNNGLSTCFGPGLGEIIGDFYSSSASLTSLDYDNDGYMDFIAGIMNKAFLFLNNLGVYEPLLIIEFPENLEGYHEMLTYGGLTTADYNNDGWDDFVAGGAQGMIRLFVNKGSQIHSN